LPWDFLGNDFAATEAFVAANRFALGLRPGELGLRGGDPRGWLLAQLDGPQAPPPELDGLPAAAPKVAEFPLRAEEEG
jgi:uncharacterized protein (DUF1800 family)